MCLISLAGEGKASGESLFSQGCWGRREQLLGEVFISMGAVWLNPLIIFENLQPLPFQNLCYNLYEYRVKLCSCNSLDISGVTAGEEQIH